MHILANKCFHLTDFLKAHKCLTSLKFNILTVNLIYYQHLAVRLRMSTLQAL